MSNARCLVFACKVTSFNKQSGVTFHSCPTFKQMRNRWHNALKNRCLTIDWISSKICSKHFEAKCFDSEGNLKDNAIPTLFPYSKPLGHNSDATPRQKINRLVSRMSQAELITSINKSHHKITEPPNVNNLLMVDAQCKPDASNEVQMWVLIKKQEHLITRLMEVVTQNKKHVEILKQNMEKTRTNKKDMDQSIETYKYIVKCLQEKLATSEEQVEILTAVESK